MLDISALQIDSDYLSRDFIDSYIGILTWVGGLIWVLIFLPIYYLVQCHSVRVFKKMYPDEKVVYVVSSGIIFTFFLTYILGAAFFGDIVPFIIFKNLQAVDRVNVNNLCAYFIAHVLMIWVMLFRISIISILSNKRVRTIVSFYKVSEKQDVKNNILYKDIDSIYFFDYPICKNLDITFKDKRELYSITCMGHLRKAKEIILNYINIERK